MNRSDIDLFSEFEKANVLSPESRRTFEEVMRKNYLDNPIVKLPLEFIILNHALHCLTLIIGTGLNVILLITVNISGDFQSKTEKMTTLISWVTLFMCVLAPILGIAKFSTSGSDVVVSLCTIQSAVCNFNQGFQVWTVMLIGMLRYLQVMYLDRMQRIPCHRVILLCISSAIFVGLGATFRINIASQEISLWSIGCHLDDDTQSKQLPILAIIIPFCVTLMILTYCMICYKTYHHKRRVHVRVIQVRSYSSVPISSPVPVISSNYRPDISACHTILQILLIYCVQYILSLALCLLETFSMDSELRAKVFCLIVPGISLLFSTSNPVVFLITSKHFRKRLVYNLRMFWLYLTFACLEQDQVESEPASPLGFQLPFRNASPLGATPELMETRF
ncbi:unnamed protein product [Owenia fusiformis]|uniref:G-protein coupled receptors family 1 profile domain-containing protein n=1 Tax=Owenia fusiformis TaxID=6347 RepID=A0A8S4NNW8_OWEFU|nr:unnamed protein product [Owenia fusiformis]